MAIPWLYNGIPSNMASRKIQLEAQKAGKIIGRFSSHVWLPAVTRYTKELEPVQMRPKGILEAHQ